MWIKLFPASKVSGRILSANGIPVVFFSVCFRRFAIGGEQEFLSVISPMAAAGRFSGIFALAKEFTGEPDKTYLSNKCKVPIMYLYPTLGFRGCQNWYGSLGSFTVWGVTLQNARRKAFVTERTFGRRHLVRLVQKCQGQENSEKKAKVWIWQVRVE